MLRVKVEETAKAIGRSVTYIMDVYNIYMGKDQVTIYGNRCERSFKRPEETEDEVWDKFRSSLEMMVDSGAEFIVISVSDHYQVSKIN